MRHKLFRILGCIGVGIVLNAAVALLCAAFADVEPSSDSISSIQRPDGQTEAKQIFDGTGLSYHERTVGQLRVSEYSVASSAMPSVVESRLLAGWPRASFACVNEGEARFIASHGSATFGRPSRSEVRGGVRLPSPDRWRAIPLMPLWPGLIVNSLLYGGAVYLLIVLLVAGRRRVRLHRGQCARCGYPQSASGRCPECGAETPTIAADS